MCLILFAYRDHPRFNLVLAANRDEFYARPAAALDFWTDQPGILAGRDLEQGGTWMGITRTGRIAAITNFRDPKRLKAGAPSRGRLVTGFLSCNMSPRAYLAQIQTTADQYNGFNLIIGDMSGLYYYSNFAEGIQPVTSGVHGLSNHLMDTPWPKVQSGKAALSEIMTQSGEPSEEALFGLLQDQTPAPDEHLPHTGVDLAWERMLSPMFITSPTYGTRCSSVVMIGEEGRIRFWERTWQAGQPTPVVEKTRYHEIGPAEEKFGERNGA